MRIILDNCTPAPLRRHLVGHEVTLAAQRGWAALSNGDLIKVAESEFDLLITCDRNLRYQQNLTGRTIAILELGVQQWPDLKPLAPMVAQAVDTISPGQYLIILERE
ncbi:hypothetical protein FEM03_13380 [Phragmitibacter flavus]|uniref:DUF5615 domain-containing protein n=1 Tax=Phragmitibacter flavus TaxID=2576071 RepID=A0A5R8KF05_9BACT|nr:hypothetical protein [Phragmitibacter flavus]TLD70179.1 hypothetical protein FEM03_13380 [Phragmitibacter flavus]